MQVECLHLFDVNKQPKVNIVNCPHRQLADPVLTNKQLMICLPWKVSRQWVHKTNLANSFKIESLLGSSCVSEKSFF